MDIVFASVALQIFICLLIADLFTGVIHWFEDTYGLPTWPLIGKTVIQPNIEHHKNPSAMATNGNFFTHVYQSVLVSGMFLGLLWLMHWLNWQIILIAVFASLGNEIHSWSHGAKSKNALVKFLHASAIVQCPHHHAKHHISPYDKDFCVLTNIVNPILERIYFWKTIESVLMFFNIYPTRTSPEREGF